MQYTVTAAAKAAGISPWRLRTWERRYGVPRPARSERGRRVYTEADLQIIKRLAALVGQGFPASQAVETVRAEEASGALQAGVEEPPLDPRLDALVEAARALDEATTVALIREAADARGWMDALETLVMPALRAVGALWERGEASVMQEHFFSQLVRRELMHAIAEQAPPHEGTPLVLLAAAEGEQHEIGHLGIWLLLRERGVRVLALGADVPASAVALAARQAEPAVICLVGVTAASAAMLATSARALVEARTGARVFVGGPALAAPAADDLIAATTLPQPLRDSVDLLMAAVGR